MTVLRITPSIADPALDALRQFCRSLFDLSVGMDRGWIVTQAADSAPARSSTLRPQAVLARPCPISRSKPVIWMKSAPKPKACASPMRCPTSLGACGDSTCTARQTSL